MIQELLYTSHEGRGLRQGGGGGYCTVLSTEGMASNLAAALEKLSGYKHPFDIHDPRSQQNPVNWRHAIIRVGGVAYHVLSRIADLKGEHTGRSNKLAHHVVIGQGDQVLGGPTRLLLHPGFSRINWNGNVELVHAVPRSSLPSDDLPLRVCRHWQSAGGDAGLAGHVADKLQTSANAVVSVIFPLGVNVLTLADEVFSLLTPELRWSTTFSTYYAAAPPISSCNLRFVLDGTADAELLRRDHRQSVVDLASPPSLLPVTPLVSAARSGVFPNAQPSTVRPRQPSLGTNQERLQDLDGVRLPNQLPALEPLPTLSAEPSLSLAQPNASATARIPSSSPKHYRASRQLANGKRSTKTWVIAGCCLLTIGVIIGGCIAIVLKTGSREVSPFVAQAPNDAPAEDDVASRSLPTTHSHVIDDPSSKKSVSAAPPIDTPTEELQPKASPSLENAVETAKPKENGVQDSAGSESPPASTIDEPRPETPTLAEKPINLLQGPRIPTLSHLSPPQTAEVESEAEILGEAINDCRLLGLEWVSDKWKASSGKEMFEWDQNGGDASWQICIPAPTALDSDKSICMIQLRNGKSIFTWDEKNTSSKIKNMADKAAILNGLKWCVLRTGDKNGTHQYLGLSEPRPPVKCNLFESGSQPLLDTIIPATKSVSGYPRIDLNVESPLLSIAGPLNPSGVLKFRFPEGGLDYVQFEVAIKDKSATDKTPELACSHILSYQVLVAEGNGGVTPTTSTSPDIPTSLQHMRDLRNSREEEIKALDDELKLLNERSKQRLEKAKQREELQSSQQKIDTRMAELNQFNATYEQLKAETATVTLDLIYSDGNDDITIPVLSKDAIEQGP